MTSIGSTASVSLGRRDPDLNRRDLAGHGLCFSCGPLTVSLRIEPKAARDEFLNIYREYPLADPAAVIDFYLKVASPTRLRRWFRPHVMPFTGFNNLPFAPLPANLAVVVAEMGLNWQTATTAHQYLIFHAGVVARGGRAIIMPGASGIGKSTLSAGLGYAGWRLFSDEFGLLRLADEQLAPNPRPVSLKNQSEAVMRAVIPADRFSSPYKETPKGTITYLLPPLDSINRMTEPATPAMIVFPTFERGASPATEAVSKAETFILMRNCGVNAERLGLHAFEILSRLVERCPAYRITYSSLDDGKALVEQLAAKW